MLTLVTAIGALAFSPQDNLIDMCIYQNPETSFSRVQRPDRAEEEFKLGHNFRLGKQRAGQGWANGNLSEVCFWVPSSLQSSHHFSFILQFV